MPVSTAAASTRPASSRATAVSTSGANAARAGPAAEAGAHLGPPQPALLADGLGLVEVAGGQLHGLDAHAVELLRVILERQRQQLEHVGGRGMRQRAARSSPASAPPPARRRRRAAARGSPAASASAAAALRASRSARAGGVPSAGAGTTSATPSLVSA